MMRLTAVLAALVMTACASGPPPQATNAVRTRPPTNVEATVSSYFDLTVPGPQTQRKLVFGAPESSHCPLFGGAGAHLGWVVPVIYDTSPSAALAKSSSVAPAYTSPVKTAKGAATSTSGTSSPDPFSLGEVSISGTRYFFWFSRDTISAVTRRGDICP